VVSKFLGLYCLGSKFRFKALRLIGYPSATRERWT